MKVSFYFLPLGILANTPLPDNGNTIPIVGNNIPKLQVGEPDAQVFGEKSKKMYVVYFRQMLFKQL